MFARLFHHCVAAKDVNEYVRICIICIPIINPDKCGAQKS